MAERFNISTVMDIAALTPEQRERCVVDLLRWCSMRDFVQRKLGEGVRMTLESSMTWIDDGKHDATIIIKPTEDQQQTGSGAPAPVDAPFPGEDE